MTSETWIMSYNSFKFIIISGIIMGQEHKQHLLSVINDR